MKIKNVRFWREGLMIRSSNSKTHEQPFEAGISTHWRMPGFKIYETEAELSGTQIRLSAEFLWLWLNVLVCVTNRQSRRWDDSYRQWGFHFMDRINFVGRWGKKYLSFDLPFVSSVFVKSEILSIDRRQVVHLCGRWLADSEAKEKARSSNSATFLYCYDLLDGTKQLVRATITVERITWRIKWTPFKRFRDHIEVQFSEEVGPKRGTWKGGILACSWALKPGETAEQGLRRMERERRFDR